MGIFLVGSGCLEGVQAGTWRSVFRSIQKCFYLRFLFVEFLLLPAIINWRHKVVVGIGSMITGREGSRRCWWHDWRPEVIIKKHTLWPLWWAKGREHSEWDWDSLMKPHFFAVNATPLPFLSVGRRGRGLPGGTVAQKEGRGRKWRGSVFANLEERRWPRCLRSQQALPLLPPLPPQCLLRKTNPRKPKQNKLPSPPPKYI